MNTLYYNNILLLLQIPAKFVVTMLGRSVTNVVNHSMAIMMNLVVVRCTFVKNAPNLHMERLLNAMDIRYGILPPTLGTAMSLSSIFSLWSVVNIITTPVLRDLKIDGSSLTVWPHESVSHNASLYSIALLPLVTHWTQIVSIFTAVVIILLLLLYRDVQHTKGGGLHWCS